MGVNKEQVLVGWSRLKTDGLVVFYPKSDIDFVTPFQEFSLKQQFIGQEFQFGVWIRKMLSRYSVPGMDGWAVDRV